MDAGPADQGPDAGADPGGAVALPRTEPPPEPLFSADGPPAEAAAAAVIEGWLERPATSDEVQAHAQAQRAAQRALVESGAAGADAVAARCDAVPTTQGRRHMFCARLLT